jgi:hypothetical protein
MQAFVVTLSNRPGELARLAETISAKGINLTGFTGAACGDQGTVCLITNDEAATRRVLADSGYSVRERELVVATLRDKPGSLAMASRRLADARVNVEAALPTGMDPSGIHVAFVTDDAAKARAALGELVRSGSAAI